MDIYSTYTKKKKMLELWLVQNLQNDVKVCVRG